MPRITRAQQQQAETTRQLHASSFENNFRNRTVSSPNISNISRVASTNSLPNVQHSSQLSQLRNPSTRSRIPTVNTTNQSFPRKSRNSNTSVKPLVNSKVVSGVSNTASSAIRAINSANSEPFSQGGKIFPTQFDDQTKRDQQANTAANVAETIGSVVATGAALL